MILEVFSNLKDSVVLCYSRFLLYLTLGEQILDTFVPTELVWLLSLQKSTLQKETKPFGNQEVFNKSSG